MNNIYKIVTFLAISVFIAFLAMKLESSFMDKFSDNILSLLTTLFAINIASTTLIAGKLREIQEKTGHPFKSTKDQLKLSFHEQIIFLVISAVASLFRESIFMHTITSSDYTKLVCDGIIIFCFMYFVDIIVDIGKALFDLLDFPNGKK